MILMHTLMLQPEAEYRCLPRPVMRVIALVAAGQRIGIVDEDKY